MFHPENVLGTPTESGCGQFGKEPCVKGTLSEAVERFNAVSVGARYYPEKQTKTPPALKPAPGNKEEVLARARARMPELDSLVNQRIAGFFGLGSTAGGTPHELTSFGEAVSSLNPALSEEEIQAWVWFHDDIKKPLEGGWRRFADAYKADNEGFAKRMAEKGILCAEPRGGALRLVPACIYYGGNIYDKLAELRQVMPEIMAAYGSGVYERQHRAGRAAAPAPEPDRPQPRQPAENKRGVAVRRRVHVPAHRGNGRGRPGGGAGAENPGGRLPRMAADAVRRPVPGGADSVPRCVVLFGRQRRAGHV